MKYTSPTEPMAHQLEALRRRTLRPPGYDDVFADIAEMGCGKSKVILDEWQEMISREYVSDLLVVAPAGCVRNWYLDKFESQPSELRRHLDPALLRALRVAGWGNSAAARRACADLIRAGDAPRALFVNVEALSAGDKAYDLCRAFMQGTRRGVYFAIDESTIIRSSRSIRTKTIVRDLDKKKKDHALRPLAKVRRIASGLMTPKSPLDLYWQFYFLDPRIIGYDDFTVFKHRYAHVKTACYEPNHVLEHALKSAMGLKTGKKHYLDFYKSKLLVVYEIIGSRGRDLATVRNAQTARAELEIAASVLMQHYNRDKAVQCIRRLGGWIKSHEEIEGYKNLDELQKKIEPFRYRVLKSDCLDLPPKVYQFREVEMTPVQKRMYAEMRDRATTELSGRHVTAESVIAQIMRLHQIAVGHTRDEEKNLIDVPSGRIASLIELLEDFDGKAIIWCHYRREIEKIVAALQLTFGENSVAQFHGGNASTRGEDEKRFLSDPACRFNVASQAAAGRGNTWVNASLATYFCNSYDLEHRMQSEDRGHRVGQKAECVTYVDFIARGTVEEKIVHALRDKLDLSTIITGENYREWLI